MTELPDDIQRAFAELPRELEPDPALEERVVRAAFPRRRPWIGLGIAAAAAVALVLLWPHSRKTGDQYVLLLHVDSTYVWPAPGHMAEREHEYGRWADSLASHGKLDLGGKLTGPGELDGMFIVRARSAAEAAQIAATCPHNKYHGYVEVRRLIE
jgi:hypothetical protein